MQHPPATEPYILAFDPGIKNFGIAAIGTVTGKTYLYQRPISTDKVRKNEFYLAVIEMLESFDRETGGLVTRATFIGCEEGWASANAKGVASDMFSIVNALGAYFRALAPYFPARQFRHVAPSVIKAYFGLKQRTAPARKRAIVNLTRDMLTALGGNDDQIALLDSKDRYHDAADAFLIGMWFLAQDPAHMISAHQVAKTNPTLFVKTVFPNANIPRN